MTLRVAYTAAALVFTACARPVPVTDVGVRDQANAPAPPGQCRVPGVHMMVVNKETERVEVRWRSQTTPPMEFRIGEAGVGTSYLRVADHVREQIFGKRGEFDVAYIRPPMNDWGTTKVRRPADYQLQLVCSENVDPSKR